MDYEISPNDPVSIAVVKAVGKFENSAPSSLPHLYETIDPDCLDGLYSSRTDRSHRLGGYVSFVFSNSRVTVGNAEYLTVEDVTRTS